MLKSLLSPAVTLCTAAVLLTACGSSASESGHTGQSGQTGESGPATSTPNAQSAAPAGGDGLPVDATPNVARESNDVCPYLDTQWLADANGQRVTSQGIDTRFSIPACVFWSYPEQPQATVLIREMPSEDEAIAVVDWAAPIDATEPAEDGDWSGGRGLLGEQTVYAVQKGNIAVVVWSNQQQTVKAETIARQAIAGAGLERPAQG